MRDNTARGRRCCVRAGIAFQYLHNNCKICRIKVCNHPETVFKKCLKIVEKCVFQLSEQVKCLRVARSVFVLSGVVQKALADSSRLLRSTPPRRLSHAEMDVSVVRLF